MALTNEQIQALIDQAELKYAEIVTTGGTSELSFGDQTVRFNQVNLAQLRAYIDNLKGLLQPADPAAASTRRAPIGFWF